MTPITFLAYDGIQALDLTGPFEVFHGANGVLAGVAPGRSGYALTVASLDGRPIVTESGLRIGTTTIERTADVHTLVLPGGFGARAAAGDERTVAAARDLAERAERVVAICTGAFLVAATGVADGRRMTTHWAWAAAFQRTFPAITVDADPIYVRDGTIWSSAGVTAGIDLALAVVEADHGVEVAQVVARWLVMFLRRPGGQTQFAAPVWNERAAATPIRVAQDLVDEDPGGDHRIALLAERVGMSERHFARRFAEETGVSPARYVAEVRIEAARRELEATADTVDLIAHRCGFGTAETMRRTFARRLGVSPDQYRQRFRHQPEDRHRRRTGTDGGPHDDPGSHPAVPTFYGARRHRPVRGAPAHPRDRRDLRRPRAR